MSDCPNAEIRDVLPDLVHGTLRGEELARVEAHVAQCADCAAEVAMLRTARRALLRAPAVDVARVAAAVQRGRVAGRSTARRRVGAGWRVGAGIAALAAGVAFVTVLTKPRRLDAPAPPAVATAPQQLPRPSTSGTVLVPVGGGSAAEVAGLGVSGALGELSDSDLRALLDDIDRLEAAPAPEPDAPLPVDLER
jgi:anti-sigma factor RsiW